MYVPLPVYVPLPAAETLAPAGLGPTEPLRGPAAQAVAPAAHEASTEPGPALLRPASSSSS